MIAWLAGDEKTEDAFATEVYSRTINIHAQDPIYLLASLIDADVPCLCVLPELKRVAFYTATKLTPAGYHELAKLPQLEQVTLSTETKEFLLGGHLESAAHLREVGFDTMTIDANMVAALNRLPRLKSLEFYGCDLSPGVLDRLQLPNLEHFNGMDSSLTNEHLAVIGKQRSLQVIDIQASDITGDAYRHLAALPNLKELHTYGASIDDESAKCVKDMRSLTLLNIDWTEITAPAVSKILKDCPRLVLRCNVQASGLTPAEQTEVKRRYDEWHARP